MQIFYGNMTLLDKFLPKEDRFAALLLYGMILATVSLSLPC